MPLYRKRPVVIEAQHLTDDSFEKVVEWMRSNGARHLTFNSHACTITIHTMEGDMIAVEDDWIIKGVAGEFYPRKDQIFQDSYEVPEPDTPSSSQGPNSDRTAIAFECAKACDSPKVVTQVFHAREDIAVHQNGEFRISNTPADIYADALMNLDDSGSDLGRAYFVESAAIAILAIEHLDQEPKQ